MYCILQPGVAAADEAQAVDPSKLAASPSTTLESRRGIRI